MKRSSWKRVERLVARKLGGVRNPLSGSVPIHTSGDIILPDTYVEVKSRKNMAIFNWWDDVSKKALKEGKRPIMVLHKVGSHKYLVVKEL